MCERHERQSLEANPRHSRVRAQVSGARERLGRACRLVLKGINVTSSGQVAPCRDATCGATSRLRCQAGSWTQHEAMQISRCASLRRGQSVGQDVECLFRM
eukprot:2024946-Rhodomonas_salina.2